MIFEVRVYNFHVNGRYFQLQFWSFYSTDDETVKNTVNNTQARAASRIWLQNAIDPVYEVGPEILD